MKFQIRKALLLLLLVLFPLLMLNVTATCAAMSVNGVIKPDQDALSKPPFDTMYINYTFSTDAPGMGSLSNGRDLYSTIPTGGPGFLTIESSIANRYVNTTSREIAQSQNGLIANGTHDWVWIPSSSTSGELIPIAVRNSTEQQFQIRMNATFEYMGKVYGCWKLTSTEGSVVYYEQSSGILVNATFLYEISAVSYQDLFIMTGTNVEMTAIGEPGIPDELIVGGIIGLGILVAAIGIAQLRKKRRLPQIEQPAGSRVKPVPANMVSKVEFKSHTKMGAVKPIPATDVVKPVPANLETKAIKELRLPRNNLDGKGLDGKGLDGKGLDGKGLVGGKYPKVEFKVEFKSQSPAGAMKPVPATQEIKPVPATTSMKPVPASEVKGTMPAGKVAKPVPAKDLEEHMG